MEHTEGQGDHLEILGAGGGGDVAGLSADIVDDGALEPRDEEVSSLVDDLRGGVSGSKSRSSRTQREDTYSLAHTRETVKDDGSVAALDVVDGGLGEGQTDSSRNCHLGDEAERFRSHSCGWIGDWIGGGELVGAEERWVDEVMSSTAVAQMPLSFAARPQRGAGR